MVPRVYSGLARRGDGRVASALDGLNDDELALPYDRFVPPFTADTGHPIWGYVAGNTFDHYQEHLPWLSAIATAG